MKKSLFFGDKKLAEFNIPSDRELKVGIDEKTGKLKIAIPKRKDAKMHG